MGNKVVVRVVLGLALSVSAGCADTVPQSSESGSIAEGTSQGLTFESHDARLLQGSFVNADVTIFFKAKAPAAGRAELDFSINGKVLGYEGVAATDAQNGWYRVDADTTFDATEIAGAQAALDALTAELGMDTTAMSLFEASVPKMAYFVANQVAEQKVASFQFNEYAIGAARPKSLNDDGKVCIRKTTSVNAYYDMGTSGSAYYQSTVVGSNWGTSNCGSGDYSCMGRCGGGCNGFGGGWTLDCLEHDVCSHNLCAGGGSSDANCGDEYNHASSDIFSSCSGS